MPSTHASAAESMRLAASNMAWRRRELAASESYRRLMPSEEVEFLTTSALIGVHLLTWEGMQPLIDSIAALYVMIHSSTDISWVKNRVALTISKFIEA